MTYGELEVLRYREWQEAYWARQQNDEFPPADPELYRQRRHETIEQVERAATNLRKARSWLRRYGPSTPVER